MTVGGPGCHTHSSGRSSLNQRSSPHLFVEDLSSLCGLSPPESLRDIGTHALSRLYQRALECGKGKPEMYQKKNSFCASRRMFCQWEVIRDKTGKYKQQCVDCPDTWVDMRASIWGKTWKIPGVFYNPPSPASGPTCYYCILKSICAGRYV